MKELLVPIDQAGRVVLPKGIRDELAIKPGDTLKVCVQGSAVMLTPKVKSAGFIRKGKALVFSTESDEILTNDMVTELLESGRQEREERITANLTKRKSHS